MVFIINYSDRFSAYRKRKKTFWSMEGSDRSAHNLGEADALGLTFLGVILLVVIFLNMSGGSNSKLVVGFLGVLLLSMILLNWAQIKPLLIKGAS